MTRSTASLWIHINVVAVWVEKATNLFDQFRGTNLVGHGEPTQTDIYTSVVPTLLQSNL